MIMRDWNPEIISGSSSFGRALAFQAGGGRFEPGLPLNLSRQLRVKKGAQIETANRAKAVVAQW
jgi:hypothetical protein